MEGNREARSRSRHVKFNNERKVVISNKQNNIYLNGEDNKYPNNHESVMFASPTALKAYRIKSKFTAGRGLKLNGVKIESKYQPSLNLKGHNVFDLVENSAQSTSSQRGVFMWVGYGVKDGKIQPSSYEVLDFNMCRISKEDDLENAGKIYYGDFSKGKKVDKWFYPFNSNKEVVKAQILRDFDIINEDIKEPKEFELSYAIHNYRGQVFFLNLDKNLVYPTHTLHATYEDAEVEYMLSEYFNKNIKGGFLGKKMIVYQGIDKEIWKEMDDDIIDWLGPEGSEGVYTLGVDQAESLDNVIKIIDVPTSYNEKQFEQTLKTVRNNIMGAFNVLSVLIDTSDKSLFGTSGDAYEAAKKIQDDLTEGDRNAIENMFYKIGLDIEIIPLTALDETVTENDTEIIEEVAEEIVKEKEEDTTTENKTKKESLFNRLKRKLWK